LKIYPLKIVCLLFAPILAGCAPKPSPGGSLSSPNTKSIGDTLTLTIVPYEAAEKLQEEYQPMADYLAMKMGVPNGKFISINDYAGVIAALQTGQVDVVYLSSFPYALATSKMKLNPLAMPWVRNNLLYRGIIFVRADSPIKTVQNLSGRTVAFGDPGSTSGYLLPRGLLEKEGILPKLKRWYNAGDANVVAKAVETGTADAGAAYELVFEVAYRGHPEKAKDFRVIAHTEYIPNGIYVARGDMPAEQVEKLKKAFLDMNTDPVGRPVMLKAPNDKIVPPDDKLFDHVRETAKIVNLDLTAFDKKKK
jgi:phosphonate transport system substrate-binding protein